LAGTSFRCVPSLVGDAAMFDNRQDFIFYTTSRVMNKMILQLSTGNHELYALRRKPDSIELQQLKKQAKDERDRRQTER